MDVGHVHFDYRALENGQGIANAVAVVGPCACVDYDGMGAVFECLMNALDHLAFVVGLKTAEANPQLCSAFLQGGIDIFQAGSTVDRWVSLAKHVEVDAM